MALPHPDDLSPQSREARERALHAVALMRREGLSLTAAAKAAGTTIETVKRYAGTALRRQPNERWRAAAWDRIVRPMTFLTRRGLISLDIKDSRSASLLGDYFNALKQYAITGDRRLLRPFWGKSVIVNRVRRFLITDPADLKRLGHAGEYRFEDIYSLSS